MASTLPPLPEAFQERMSRLLGEEYPAFAAALDGAPRRGLRVNTLKLSTGEFRRISPFPLGERLAWCDSAFALTPSPFAKHPFGAPEGIGEPVPGKHPYHLAGLYYLQDPSAISAAELLGPEPGERILDLAAAPGGKTTHLASRMQGRGLLVANEIKPGRLGHLVFNVERWGAGNVAVINETPERLADHLGAAFDRVLVDAPCSGEGTFCRDPAARRDWSLRAVADYAARQLGILRTAARLVRPGGRLLYSTCTFAPEEDEGTLAGFLQACPDFEVVALPQMAGFMPGRPEWLRLTAESAEITEITEKQIKNSALPAGSAVNESLRGAVRLLPHRIEGDGHFVALLQRTGGAADERTGPWSPGPLPAGLAETWRAFREKCLAVDFPAERLRLQGERLYLVPEGMLEMKGLRVTVPGVWLGTFKKERFEPAHPLALYLRRDQVHSLLDLPADGREIAAYLRGESLASGGAPGWVLVCADGFPLGWGKRVQGRLKNHYPRGWMVGP